MAFVCVAVIAPLETGLTRSPTVRMKLVLVVVAPSVTLTVIVVRPDCPVAGVIDSVRLAPEPPTVMFALGMIVVLPEVAVTVREEVAVSASPTVTTMPLIIVFELVPWSAIAAMVGAAVAHRSITTPDEPAVLESPPLPELATVDRAALMPRPMPPRAYVTLEPVNVLVSPVDVPLAPPPEPPMRAVPAEPVVPLLPCPVVAVPPAPPVPLYEAPPPPPEPPSPPATPFNVNVLAPVAPSPP